MTTATVSTIVPSDRRDTRSGSGDRVADPDRGRPLSHRTIGLLLAVLVVGEAVAASSAPLGVWASDLSLPLLVVAMGGLYLGTSMLLPGRPRRLDVRGPLAEMYAEAFGGRCTS